MKLSLSLAALCLLPSCFLFAGTHPDVVKGQLAAYEGVKNLEHNHDALLTEFETQQKLLITYIHNYAFQVNFDHFQQDHPIADGPYNESEEDQATREQENRSNQIAVEEKRIELEAKRDKAIAKDHARVDENMVKWRAIGKKGHSSVKELLTAVYNNISASPIQLDTIATMVDKSHELWREIEQ